MSLRRHRPGLRKTPDPPWNLTGTQPPGPPSMSPPPAQAERCGPPGRTEVRRDGPGGSQVATKRRTRTARSGAGAGAGAALRGQELASATVAGREKEALASGKRFFGRSGTPSCRPEQAGRVPGRSEPDQSGGFDSFFIALPMHMCFPPQCLFHLLASDRSHGHPPIRPIPSGTGKHPAHHCIQMWE